MSCVITTSAGFLYGYDLVIAGGVSNMNDFLEKFYPQVLATKTSFHTNTYCKYNNHVFQLFTSSLYMGAFLSTFIASVITRKFVCCRTITIAALLFDVGTTLSAGASNLATLLSGCVLIDCGIGFANQAVPVYLSEVAPPIWRGRLHLTFGTNITIGAFFGSIINYFSSKIHPWGWRLSMGAVIPSLILTFGSLFLVESPNSLIECGNAKLAKVVLRRLRGTYNVEVEFYDLVEAKHKASHIHHQFRSLFLSRENRPQLVMAFALPFFQQVAENDGIMFYGLFLFKIAGFKDDVALFSTIIIGATIVTFGFISIFLVDWVGHHQLLILPSFFMLGAQVVIAIIFALRLQGESQYLPHAEAIVEVRMLCLFTSSFSCSWGPLPWLVTSEIFPLEIRSTGQSVAVFSNMFFKILIAKTFLSMVCVFKYGIFLFFASWVGIMNLFKILLMPETKGVPIEEMHIIWAQHWFWKRFLPPRDDQIKAVPNIL